MGTHIKQENEDWGTVLKIATEDDDNFLVLSKSQAQQVAKFPVGSRVLHSVMKEDKMFASFGTVEAAAIYLPTRESAYKVHSNIAAANFVLEPDLVFAPETPVWAVLPGEKRSAAIVLVGTRSPQSGVYSLMSAATNEVHHLVDSRKVSYRHEPSAPQPLPQVQRAAPPQVQRAAIPQVQRDTIPQVQRDAIPQVQRDAIPQVQRDAIPENEEEAASAGDSSITNTFGRGSYVHKAIEHNSHRGADPSPKEEKSIAKTEVSTSGNEKGSISGSGHQPKRANDGDNGSDISHEPAEVCDVPQEVYAPDTVQPRQPKKQKLDAVSPRSFQPASDHGSICSIADRQSTSQANSAGADRQSPSQTNSVTIRIPELANLREFKGTPCLAVVCC